MAKIISYNEEAREKLLKGVDAVANCVKTTIGPRGKNVIIGKKYGSPVVVNDGITIAKEIELSDPLENAGAQLLKDVSSKTNEKVGDGTTTASVLAQAIVHEGLKAIEQGANGVLMKDGINKATEKVIEFINEKSLKVDDTMLEHVASVSAGNNKEIGSLIATAIKQVGEDGIVTVEESNTIGTKLKSAEGMQLDKGYLSPYFITDNERMETVLDKPYILLVNKKINLVQDIMPILEKVAQEGRSILIIAEDVEGEALAMLVVNTMRKVLRCCAVKAPGFGDGRKEGLIDIGVLTGGEVWLEELGIDLSQVGPNFFGKAKRVVVKKDETTIIVDDSTKDAIKTHVETLKKQLEKAETEYQKEKLQQRIARLVGGVAVIEVGAVSEVELKERKLRIEDALNATKAAKEEGIVAGGGYTLLEAQQECRRDWETKPEEVDFAMGYDILIKALSLPAYQIAENAGQNAEDVVAYCKGKHVGYNALTNKYENLIESGVIDPAKVTKSALQNAASVAGMLLTTEAAIVDEPITQENGVFAPQSSMMM